MTKRRPPPEQWSTHEVSGRAPFRTIPSPRRRGDGAASAAVCESAVDPTLPLAIVELWDLRRLGLFDDDGRAPPSWWDR